MDYGFLFFCIYVIVYTFFIYLDRCSRCIVCIPVFCLHGITWNKNYIIFLFLLGIFETNDIRKNILLLLGLGQLTDTHQMIDRIIIDRHGQLTDHDKWLSTKIPDTITKYYKGKDYLYLSKWKIIYPNNRL